MTAANYFDLMANYDLAQDTEEIKNNLTLCVDDNVVGDKECCRCLKRSKTLNLLLPQADAGCAPSLLSPDPHYQFLSMIAGILVLQYILSFDGTKTTGNITVAAKIKPDLLQNFTTFFIGLN